MNISKYLAAFLIALVMSSGAAFADLHGYADAADSRSERESDLYEDGTDAIDDEEWEDAIRQFARVAEMKGSRTDGALYWTAYALNKLNRRSEALKSIETLKKDYPKSRWLNDAKALEVEVRSGAGERVRPEQYDDETKVIAIQTLMHTDSEKAYPLLEKIIKSANSSKKMKEQALFVLSQSSSPKAQQLLADIAKGNAHPGVQRDAIRYLGIHGGKRSGALLAEIYASNVPVEVKKEVLQAYMISGNKAGVLAAAKGETNSDLREKAINLLGVMGARAELSSMYATETSRDLREEIINALFIAGDSTRLGELARNEKDPKLRAEAIRKLGLMGGTGQTLLGFYATGDENVKDAVIDALFVQGNAKALISLARKETDRQMKKEILQKLSVMGNDDAVAYMLEILED
jgi:HEAT repeats